CARCGGGDYYDIGNSLDVW
nr:immunoglobulin heavy chain junction region [Macaca mulatta]MOW98643.1 immunoglobulin heavy chain junction region [Macaca mulatta]MOW98957.1 immunoglobulin heavy chain junction region [Macaca mulatta]MOX00223.1 immunoglobulin heavy chain junction region [Macaca mulatta]MOX00878.1 immunoglobulin heavy chain junction region [Macaca mulatta]